MSTENKNSWMVWAIVILAIMNIATLLTVIYQKHQTEADAVVTEEGQPLSETASINYSGRYFRDQLSLTNKQMDRFTEFNPVFRGNVRSVNLNLNLLRQKMYSEMAAEKSDTMLLNSLSDSIGHMHANLKRMTYKYYLDLKNICDQEQQKKLEQLFSGMFVSDGPMGQYGKGGQQGRRRGRQFNN